jgi:hypothetical protein
VIRFGHLTIFFFGVKMFALWNVFTRMCALPAHVFCFCSKMALETCSNPFVKQQVNEFVRTFDCTVGDGTGEVDHEDDEDDNNVNSGSAGKGTRTDLAGGPASAATAEMIVATPSFDQELVACVNKVASDRWLKCLVVAVSVSASERPKDQKPHSV